MKKIIHLAIIVTSILSVSCSSDEPIKSPQPNEPERSSELFEVSIDEARADLLDILKGLDDCTSRVSTGTGMRAIIDA